MRSCASFNAWCNFAVSCSSPSSGSRIRFRFLLRLEVEEGEDTGLTMAAAPAEVDDGSSAVNAVVVAGVVGRALLWLPR